MGEFKIQTKGDHSFTGRGSGIMVNPLENGL